MAGLGTARFGGVRSGAAWRGGVWYGKVSIFKERVSNGHDESDV